MEYRSEGDVINTHLASYTCSLIALKQLNQSRSMTIMKTEIKHAYISVTESQNCSVKPFI